MALSYLRRSPCRSRRSSRCSGFYCCALGSIHTSAVRVRGCSAFAPPPCRKLRSLLLHLGRGLGGAASRQRTELPWAPHLMPQACWLFSSFFCGACPTAFYRNGWASALVGPHSNEGAVSRSMRPCGHILPSHQRKCTTPCRRHTHDQGHGHLLLRRLRRSTAP